MISYHADEKLFTNQGIYFGWRVVGAAFIIITVSLGSFDSYGIIFLPVATEFGWSRGLLSWVALIAGFTYAFVAPLTGWLADRFGFKQVACVMAGILGLGFLLSSQIQSIWQLYFFMGFIPGLGCPVAIALPLSLVAHWFVSRRGLAIGVASAGVGAGTAMIPLLVAFIVSNYGWRVACGCLGILIWIVCLPAALLTMRSPKIERNGLNETRSIAVLDSEKSGEENRGLSVSAALRTASFWLLFWVFAVCNFGLGMVMIHLVPYAQDAGLPAIAAAGLMTTIGLCGIIGRILSGLFSDRFGSRIVLFLGIFIQSGLMLLLLKAGSLWIFYLFAVCFGLSVGGNIMHIPKLTAQIFGLNSMAAIFGALSVADGIGFGVGPLIAGYLFDATGSYDISFIIVAIGLALVAFLTLHLKEKSLLTVVP